MKKENLKSELGSFLFDKYIYLCYTWSIIVTEYSMNNGKTWEIKYDEKDGCVGLYRDGIVRSCTRIKNTDKPETILHLLEIMLNMNASHE